MWPFGKKKANRLAAAAAPGGGAAAPVEVSVEVVVASPNALTSSITGMQAALFVVEIVERAGLHVPTAMGATEEVADHYTHVASAVFGDTLVLRDADGSEVTVVARRARVGFAVPQQGGTPLARVPPELVPLVQRASGRGVLCFRESMVRQGDRYRLTATIEAVPSVVASGYRSDAGLRFVARDDISVVGLEEIFEVPDF